MKPRGRERTAALEARVGALEAWLEKVDTKRSRYSGGNGNGKQTDRLLLFILLVSGGDVAHDLVARLLTGG